MTCIQEERLRQLGAEMKAELCSGSLTHLREMTSAFLQELKASLSRQALADPPLHHPVSPDSKGFIEDGPADALHRGTQYAAQSAPMTAGGDSQPAAQPSSSPQLHGECHMNEFRWAVLQGARA